MRKTLIALSVAGVMAGCSSSQEAVPEDPALESTDEKVSYGMGLVMGQRMSNDLPNLKMEQFLQGIQHGHDGDEEQTRMSREEIQEALMAYQTQLQEQESAQAEELAKKNQEAGEQFLAENAKRDGVKTTESGLQYEILEEGDGEKPTVTFGLNQVIPGWTEGLQLMSEGSRAKLYIPSELAYGPGGNQRIGPNETLVFDVELLEINPE